MKKKLLYILPDYSYATLNQIKMLSANFDIHIVAPYHIKYLNNRLCKAVPQLRRRVQDWQQLTSGLNPVIISNNLFRFLFVFWKYYRKHKRYILSNILKMNLELYIVQRIDFQKYDVLFSFDGCSLVYQKEAKKYGLTTIMESRGNQIDTVSKIHESLNAQFNTSLPTSNGREKKWFHKLREEVNYSDFIITYSDFHQKQFLQKLKYPHQQVLKMPIPSKFPMWKKPPEYKNRIDITFIGNQSAAKGVNILRNIWHEQFNLIPDNYNLVFIGSVEFEDEEADAGKRIFYKGFLPAEGLQSYLKENDSVVVLPTFYDSYGMVVIEALSHCIPVVTNENCGASEYIIHGKTGFIYKDPFDKDALQSLIMKLIHSPEILQEFSRNLAETNIGETIARQRKKAYQELITGLSD